MLRLILAFIGVACVIAGLYLLTPPLALTATGVALLRLSQLIEAK